jgi:hypothetical protein
VTTADHRRHRRDEVGAGDTEPRPTAPPRIGQRHRLEQELPRDVTGAGPEGLAQADLAGPLADGDEHDVGHPDATDQQRDPGDGGQHQRQDLQDLAHHADDLVLADQDAELVGARAAHRAPDSTT